MKIKKPIHYFVVIFICACTGLNGWFFGQAGGDTGAVTGIITGIIAGVLFILGYYHEKKSLDRRLLEKAAKLGAIYGTISGFLVHVPNLFMYYILGKKEAFHGVIGGVAIYVGPIFGMVSGAILGFILGLLLSINKMEDDTPANV